ncbi:MAG: biotin/lipoyl-binding protein, partial [Acetobacteraceae bacterium]|nr:biotin/lipoyl-binding protein [Acetobacteraceae bacterium]
MKRGPMVLLLPAILAAGIGAWRYLGHRRAPDVWQGYVEAEYVRVAPVQPGLLTGLAVARGNQVSAGDLLFAQDEAGDRAARDQAAAALAEAEARLVNLCTPGRPAEIAQAEANLADSRAAYDRISRDLARNETLVRTGVASRQLVEQEQADVRSAAAKVEAASARLSLLREPSGRPHEILAQQK